jgi:hypothetical protein
MNVEQIMMREVQCCGPDTNLAAAASMSFDDVIWTMKAISTHRILVGV